MIKYLALILLLTSVSAHASKLKVLWWNIGGNFYSTQNSAGQNNLDISLQKLASSDYDVIALGEYVTGRLSSKTIPKLKQKFKFSTIVNYNPHYGKSILILSKHNFTYREKVIDWVKSNWGAGEVSLYRNTTKFWYGNTKHYKRKYLRIKLEKENTEHNLIFSHMNNPWPGLVKTMGKYLTASEILFGTDNPLYNQITRLNEELSADFSYSYQDKNIVFLGDTNCPYKIKGLVAACYRALRRKLTPVHDAEKLNTYPAIHSTMAGKQPSVKIDHALVSDNIKSSTLKVMSNLKGSDHLALRLIYNAN